ncbi:MAG: AMP-binding protein [Candidatus Nanopelagicales bacterium]
MYDLDDRPWTRHYPPGTPASYRSRVRNGVEMFQIGVAERPDGPAMHFFDETMSHAEEDALAHALAAAFVERGVTSGDRVGLYLQNDPQFVIALHAAWLIGAIVVTHNPMLRARELNFQLLDSGVRTLICLDSLHATAVEGARGTSVIDIFTTSEFAFAGATPPEILGRRPDAVIDLPRLEDLFSAYAGRRVDPYLAEPSELALLCYTSGTTGPPKAAMLVHMNIAYGEVYLQVGHVSPDDVVMAGAPLFHVTGITGHIAAARLNAAPMVLFHRFDAGEYLRMLERWHCTYSILALTAHIAIINHPDLPNRDISSLTKVFTGGAPVSPSMVARYEEVTGQYMHNTYGMTETSSPTHMVPPGMRAPIDPVTGALSVGLPVPNVFSTVVDLTTDEVLGEGQLGEIVSMGPDVVAGYWNKPEETAHALRGGVMHTGDVATRNADGWFFLVDRAKDLIVVSGYKVWPREVEDVLYEHPAVREAAVVGIPDEYRGETVKAFVSLRPGFEGTTSEELRTHCKDLLSAYKYPRIVEILPEIPKTTTGKFLRRDLRQSP